MQKLLGRHLETLSIFGFCFPRRKCPTAYQLSSALEWSKFRYHSNYTPRTGARSLPEKISSGSTWGRNFELQLADHYGRVSGSANQVSASFDPLENRIMWTMEVYSGCAQTLQAPKPTFGEWDNIKIKANASLQCCYLSNGIYCVPGLKCWEFGLRERGMWCVDDLKSWHLVFCTVQTFNSRTSRPDVCQRLFVQTPMDNLSKNSQSHQWPT